MPALVLLALASAVTALPLPEGYTVDAEATRRLMAVNTRGTVIASIVMPSGYGKDGVVRWRHDGSRSAFVPLPPSAADVRSYGPGSVIGTALGPDDSAYVEVERPFTGSATGVAFETQRWAGAGTARFNVRACGGAHGAPHVADVDAHGRIAIIYDTLDAPYLNHDDPAADAPYANVATATSCLALGRGIVRAVRGAYAAGFREYSGTMLVPVNMDVPNRTTRAVRWHGARAEELGPGVACGVNVHGVTVGWNDRGAAMWDRAGRVSALVPGVPRSAAYDVADDGTVVGMLVDRHGKHRAFRRRRGVLTLLDDLPHPAGWRFEAAFALGTGGEIVGIGTLRGIATGFVYRDATP